MNIKGSATTISRKLMIFGLMKLIKNSSPLIILCIIICQKMKRSCQGDLEVREKLNHQAQVLVMFLESLKNKLRSKLFMKKLKIAELEVLAFSESNKKHRT